jgi:hypothetical protein
MSLMVIVGQQDKNKLYFSETEAKVVHTPSIHKLDYEAELRELWYAKLAWRDDKGNKLSGVLMKE